MRNSTRGGILLGFIALAMLVLVIVRAGTDTRPTAFVATDAEPFRCSGTEITRIADEPDDPQSFTSERIELLPDLDCRIRFWVVNERDREIRVDRITMPFVGDASGSGLHATNLTPWRSGAVEWYGATPPLDDTAEYSVEDSGLDATWTVDDTVEPGQRLYYEVVVRFDPADCQSDGGTLSFDGPSVHLDGDAEPLTYLGPRVSVGGTYFSSCDQ